jgi:hypothetical protein
MDPCQCCQRFTIEPTSLYEICPICDWQQEPTLYADGELDLNTISGANGTTLREARGLYRIKSLD